MILAAAWVAVAIGVVLLACGLRVLAQDVRARRSPRRLPVPPVEEKPFPTCTCANPGEPVDVIPSGWDAPVRVLCSTCGDEARPAAVAEHARALHVKAEAVRAACTRAGHPDSFEIVDGTGQAVQTVCPTCGTLPT